MEMEMNCVNTFNGKARHMGLKPNSLCGLCPAPRGYNKVGQDKLLRSD